MQLLPFTYSSKLLIAMWMCKKNKLAELSNCSGMVTSPRSFHSWPFCNSSRYKVQTLWLNQKRVLDRQITGTSFWPPKSPCSNAYDFSVVWRPTQTLEPAYT